MLRKIFIFIFINALFIDLFAFSLSPKTSIIKLENYPIVIYAHCDQVIKDPVQIKCYSYFNHETLFNMYFLDSNVSKSIKKRLNFREDRRIPKRYQNFLKCYHRNPQKQDRGHLMPDASADYNKIVLRTTYLTSNIVPEYYRTNRYSISKGERQVRDIALHYNTIVITGIIGSQGRLKNNNNCAIIPNKIYKIIFIKKNNKWIFLKAFVFKNGTENIKIFTNRLALQKIENEAHIIIKY